MLERPSIFRVSINERTGEVRSGQAASIYGNVPVMCTYEELLTAIWGEEPNHTETDVNHLIWELRKKLEPDPKEPKFLETVRGLGYRLGTRLGTRSPRTD